MKIQLYLKKLSYFLLKYVQNLNTKDQEDSIFRYVGGSFSNISQFKIEWFKIWYIVAPWLKNTTKSIIKRVKIIENFSIKSATDRSKKVDGNRLYAMYITLIIHNLNIILNNIEKLQ